MCAPAAASVAIPIAQAGIGAIGAQGKTAANNAAISARNRATRRNYAAVIQQQNEEWNNTLKIWNQRLDQYGKQLERNMDAAYGYGGAYMGLQVQTNEAFREAAFQSQDSFVKLNQVLGTAQATGQTGKTAERFDVASLAAFGRERALQASNLTATIDKQKLDQENVRRQLDNANQQAWQQVSVAPVPGRRPLAPTLQAKQSTNYTPFILEGAMGAFTGGAKAGVFGQDLQGLFLPNIRNAEDVGSGLK
jgi:hypothetical protein